MRNVILALILLAVVLVCTLNSCNLSATDQKTNPIADSPAVEKQALSGADNSISFKVNGQSVTTSAWTIIRFLMNGQPGLNIVSNMKTDKRTVMFNLNDQRAGNHDLFSAAKEPGTGYGNFKPDYEDALEAYSFQIGRLNVVSIDTLKGLLNAEFSGTVTNTRGESLIISEGRIVNGKINTGIITY